MRPTLHTVREALGLIGGLNPLWPGFEPADIPLVVWDGLQTTLLSSRTAPGPEWTATPAGWTLPFRHPALVADTAVTLEGGVEAAALLLDDPPTLSARDLAALIVHERFHVYQRGHPERWQADELAVFGYPLTAPVLAARRLETRALRLALGAGPSWRGHAAEALHWRKQRQHALTPAQTELERGLERREGLACFTELKVSGQPPILPLPDFAPAEIRRRCYSTGAALALLLDRTGEWQRKFMHGSLSLDETLHARLGPRPRSAAPPEVIARARAGAAFGARTTETRLQHLHQTYLGGPGPRLTLTAAEPIWPRGFDPLSLSDLGGGRVLHGRLLQFGNARLSGEVLGRAALTLGAGPHPLTTGFASLILTGLDAPRLWTEENALHFRAQGAELQVVGTYRLEEQADGQGWHIGLR